MDSLKEVGLKTIILEVLGLMWKQYEMISNTSVGCTLSWLLDVKGNYSGHGDCML